MGSLKEMDLSALVGEMTMSMLGADATESGATPDEGVRQVIGVVHLHSDDWQGSILVAMPDEDARTATATMFMLGPDDVDDELVADAMGEFANVLAGMAKTAIGGGCSLSLPSVTSGSGLKVVVPGAALVESKSYDTGHGQMTVSTLERK